MNREYHRWWSADLGRDMEMLVFGHGGTPAVVFPTSCGRFFDFEDRGMVAALQGQIAAGRLQLFCVDSVDCESWYNSAAGVDGRLSRHLQYESYVLNDIAGMVRERHGDVRLVSVGCSFGGYHAMNIAVRHPDVFSGCVSMSGAFDLRKLGFLRGLSTPEGDRHLPLEYLTRLSDRACLDRLRKNSYMLATGVQDQCWKDNERMAATMRQQAIPVRLDVWGEEAAHDWPWWQRMVQTYL